MAYPTSERNQGKAQLAKSQLTNSMSKNQECLCIMTKDQLSALYQEKVLKQCVETSRVMAGYVSPVNDLIVLTKVLKDLGVKSRIYEKKVNGKSYVIFKGNQKVRKIITGTRYLASHSKVVSMAIGKAAVQKSVRSGAKLTVYLTVPIIILEHILKRERVILKELIADVAVSLLKVGISTIAAALAAAAIGTVTTIAAAPLAVAIFVGLLVGYMLDKADSKYGLTAKLVEILELIEDSTIGELKRGFSTIERTLRWQIMNGISPGRGMFY